MAEDKIKTDRPAVYLVRSENGLCKIGHSRQPTRRLAALETGSPERLSLVWEFRTPHAAALERALHKRFEVKRAHGEWFAISDDDVKQIHSLVLDPRFPFPAPLRPRPRHIAASYRDEEGKLWHFVEEWTDPVNDIYWAINVNATRTESQENGSGGAHACDLREAFARVRRRARLHLAGVWFGRQCGCLVPGCPNPVRHKNGFYCYHCWHRLPEILRRDARRRRFEPRASAAGRLEALRVYYLKQRTR